MAGKPSVTIMRITPALAAKWLKQNHEQNRNLRPNKVEEYASDMEAGNWELNDQAISFSQKRVLINGQHRLHAVVKSGRTIDSIVMFNAPDNAFLVIDGGMRRNTDDRFAMGGLDYPSGSGSTVRRALLGLAGGQRLPISDRAVEEFLSRHGKAVAFAHEHLPKKALSSASARAVLLRAYLAGVPLKKLSRFAEVLRDGFTSDPAEAGIIRLRDRILSQPQSSSSLRAELYGLTEAVLRDYLAGVVKERLYPVSTEQFPFPDSPADQAAA